jgi:predicted ATPase/transcriptional regulator with XRE-family HTH domain
MTQQELANRSGLSVRGIRRLEAGERTLPRLETVRFLSEALGLSDEDHQSLLRAARPELNVRARKEKLTHSFASDSESTHRNTNLPAPVNATVGRSKTIAEITARLSKKQTRLLTITGPPGIGKTRVAIEAARNMLPALAGGVHVVWLATIADPALVMPTIAESLSLRPRATRITVPLLAEKISDSRMLLVLDNMEHLVSAALVIPALLERCPNLLVIATSRTRLRVTGEDLFPLSPLALSGGHESQMNGRLVSSAAEELFLLRARSADPAFQVTETNAALVSEICRRVDGLPLAIELAAGQLSQMSLADIALRTEKLLPLLKDGPGDQPGRLRTMSESLEWSFSLLSPAEQRLLISLGVFRGGFTLDSARFVSCWKNDKRECEETFESTLRTLVEGNLVGRPAYSDSVPRYALLELIREFARDKLVQHAEEHETRASHARWFADLALENERRYWIPGQDIAELNLAADLPNIREALEWFEAIGDGESMLITAGSLLGYWTAFGNLQEGQRWIERALVFESVGSPLALSKALIASGRLHLYQGDVDLANIEYKHALEKAIEADDPIQIASAGSSEAAMAVLLGEYERGLEVCVQTLRAINRIEDQELGEAIAIWIPGTMGRAEHGLGNWERADDHFRHAAELMQESGNSRGATRVFGAWGTLAVDQGRLQIAMDRFLKGMQQGHIAGDDVYLAINMKMAASVMALQGRGVAAARLFGAVRAYEGQSGALLAQNIRDARVQEHGIQALHDLQTDQDLQPALEDGSKLTLLDALDEALLV